MASLLITECGVTATVEPRLWDERDSFGNYVEAYGEPVDVDNVLVVPGPCDELDDSRPEGVKVALTLHFPKTWTSDLRGAKVALTGRYSGSYRVIGKPMPYMEVLTPTQWNMPVEVEVCDG